MLRRVLPFFFFLVVLVAAVQAKPKPLPKNADQGDILLAGLVLAPGEGAEKAGFPSGLVPLSGALVSIEGTELSTTTDARGLFVFVEAPDGDVIVVISKPGFETVRRRTQIGDGVDTSSTLRVEMLPVGSTVVNGALSGPGTLYVSFVPTLDVAQEAGDTGLFNYLKALAAGVNLVEDLRNEQLREINGQATNSVTSESNVLMVYPPTAPSRTTFTSMVSAPIWPCFNKSGKVLYVSHVGRRIDVLDVDKGNELLAWIPIEENRFASNLNLSADGRTLWVTTLGPVAALTAIDTSTHLAARELVIEDAVGMFTTSSASSATPPGLYVTLTNGTDPNSPGSLVLLEPESGRTIAKGAVGVRPTQVLLSADGTTAYVCNSGSGSVSALDSQTLVSKYEVKVEASPVRMALTPDGRRLLVTNRVSGTVSVIDVGTDGVSARLTARIKVGLGPLDIEMTQDGRWAYVSNCLDGTLSTIDVQSAAVISVSTPMPKANPLGIAIRP